MTSFSIRVIDNVFGEIAIADFVERFELELSDWSSADYRRSWKLSLEELLVGTCGVALMTWTARPTTPLVRRAWTLHHEGVGVSVQERLFLPDDKTTKLDATGRVVDVGPVETVSEEGHPISTWTTSTAAIAAFLNDS